MAEMPDTDNAEPDASADYAQVTNFEPAVSLGPYEETSEHHLTVTVEGDRAIFTWVRETFGFDGEKSPRSERVYVTIARYDYDNDGWLIVRGIRPSFLHEPTGPEAE